MYANEFYKNNFHYAQEYYKNIVINNFLIILEFVKNEFFINLLISLFLFFKLLSIFYTNPHV